MTTATTLVALVAQITAEGGWRFAEGAPQTFTAQNPAAGAQWSLAFPTNRLLLLLAVQFKIATSTTAGTRRLAVKITGKTGKKLAYTPAAGPVTASKTAFLSAWPNAPVVGTPVSHVTTTLPRIVFPPGCTLNSDVTTLKAGDAITHIAVIARLV